MQSYFQLYSKVGCENKKKTAEARAAARRTLREDRLPTRRKTLFPALAPRSSFWQVERYPLRKYEGKEVGEPASREKKKRGSHGRSDKRRIIRSRLLKGEIREWTLSPIVQAIVASDRARLVLLRARNV